MCDNELNTETPYLIRLKTTKVIINEPYYKDLRLVLKKKSHSDKYGQVNRYQIIINPPHASYHNVVSRLKVVFQYSELI